MTVPTPGDARPRLAGLRRWLLGMVTLVLAIGVVVMHSLGLGHQGAAVAAPSGSAAAGHASSGHATSVHAASAHAASAHAVDRLATAAHVMPSEPVVVALVDDGQGAALTRAGHGAMMMCLAVLPLLLLLRSRGDRAWFARARTSARRPLAGLPAAWLSLPPGRAGPSLSELCILRT